MKTLLPQGRQGHHQLDAQLLRHSSRQPPAGTCFYTHEMLCPCHCDVFTSLFYRHRDDDLSSI